MRAVERAAGRLARPRRVGRTGTRRNRGSIPGRSWCSTTWPTPPWADSTSSSRLRDDTSRRGRRASPTSARRSATAHPRHRSAPCASPADHLRSPPWSCTTPRSGSRSPTRSPTATAVVHGDTHAHVGASTTIGPPASPRRSPPPASAPTPRSGCTCTTATSTSRRSTAAFKMRGVPVNVNYRYLDDELWYLLDNADAEALVFHSSLGDRVAQRRRPPPQAEAADRGRRRRQRPGRRRPVATRR